MKAQFSQKDNSGMALTAGIAGLLCFTVLPFMIARAMTAVLEGAAAKIPVKRPLSAHVEKAYLDGDLSQLGIGT